VREVGWRERGTTAHEDIMKEENRTENR